MDKVWSSHYHLFPVSLGRYYDVRALQNLFLGDKYAFGQGRALDFYFSTDEIPRKILIPQGPLLQESDIQKKVSKTFRMSSFMPGCSAD